MSKHVVTLGTAEPGGINSVINGYCENGLFNNKSHTRIISHMGRGKFQDLVLFISAIIRLLWLSILNRKLILHCHMSYKGSFWRKLIFVLIAKCFRNQSIVHLHGSEFKDYYSSRTFITKALIVWLINACDYFVVLSDSWADYIFSISGTKAHVINNYVDVCKLDVTRKPADILFLGAFIKRKGIYELLQACAKLDRPFHLHLCGSGEEQKVSALVEELKLNSKITVHGWIDTQQKIKLLSSSGVMILPSFNEGLPMTIIESMACEIPIISTPVGAIPEVIIEGKTGYLVEPGNVDSIKNKLEYVLSSPPELTDVVMAARKMYASKYCSEIILPKWEDIYEDASTKVI